jgi:ankyrin repeat protein
MADHIFDGVRTALFPAAQNGNKAALTKLLAAGADAHINAGGYTALAAAALNGHEEINNGSAA